MESSSNMGSGRHDRDCKSDRGDCAEAAPCDPCERTERIRKLREKVQEQESKVLDDVSETTRVAQALKQKLDRSGDTSRLKRRMTKLDAPAAKIHGMD